MVTHNSGERASLVNELHQEIADRSEQVTASRRGPEAFFVLPGEERLQRLLQSPTVDMADKVKAAELLEAHRANKTAVVESLPALDSINPYPAGASVSERFWPFVTHAHLLRNLDLWRKQHRLDITDWQSADHLQQSLDDLLEQLATVMVEHGQKASYQRFIPTIFQRDSQNCNMFLDAISGPTLKAGLACLTRNTVKTVVVDALTGDVITFVKRTVFGVDLSALASEYLKLGDNSKVELVRSMLAGVVLNANGFNLSWVTTIHEFAEDLITNQRHRAIKPISTRLFVYRERQPQPVSIANPEDLQGYPVVQAVVAGNLGSLALMLDTDPVGLAEDEANLALQRRAWSGYEGDEDD